MGMWSDLRDSFVLAMKERNVDQWFVKQAENRNNMRTEYISAGDTERFLAMLNRRAAMEACGHDQDIVLFSVGGHS